jgi:glycosyltransferase involved in cell wall biosynthesis
MIVPCYNEAQHLEPVLRRLLVALEPVGEFEVLLVDDASTDDSPVIGRRLAQEDSRIHFLPLARNQGKGGAIRAAIPEARGDVVAIHDVDEEYDPADILPMFELIASGQADAVVGNRYAEGSANHHPYLSHKWANHLFTGLFNLLYGTRLQDVGACTKLVRRELLQKITLTEPRFGFDIEVLARLAQLRLPGQAGPCRPVIRNVPQTYHGRTYAEGKKILWHDGPRAIWCLVKYRVV